LVVVWSGYLLLAWQEQHGGQLGGYKSYKFISFFLPALLLSSWLLFRRLSSWRGLARSGAWTALAGLLIGANLAGDRAMAVAHVPSARVVEGNLAGIRAISQDRRIAAINLMDNRVWDLMWMNNFLIDKRLAFLTSGYSGRSASPLDAPWDLIPRDMGWGQGVIVHWNLATDQVDLVDIAAGWALNDGYLVAARRRLRVLPDDFLVRRGARWMPCGAGQFAMDPAQGSGTLIVRAPPQRTIRFRAAYRREPWAKALSVTLNGYRVASCAHPEFCWIDDLPVRTGDNVLELTVVSQGGAVPDDKPAFIFSALDVFAVDSRPVATASHADAPAR
jgi:hypothetical protein